MDDKSKNKDKKIPLRGDLGGLQLRSEKVRNIIGQVSPVLIRYGITIIVISFVLLICLAAFISYQPSFKTEVIISQNMKSEFDYTVKIPEEIVKYQGSFQDVIIDEDLPDNSLPLGFGTPQISDTINITKSGSYRMGRIYPLENRSVKVKLSKSLVLSGRIRLKKTNLLFHFLTFFYKSH